MIKNNTIPLKLNLVKAFIPNDGWFNDYDIKNLWSLLDYVPLNGTYVECGSFCGRSICSISEYIIHKKIKAYTIEIEEVPYMVLIENIKQRRLNKHITTIHNDSRKEVINFKDKSIDMIFIDSAHRYDHLVEEISLYKNKMKDDSIISGHDFDQTNYSQIVKAIQYCFGSDYVVMENRKKNCGIWYGFRKDLKI